MVVFLLLLDIVNVFMEVKIVVVEILNGFMLEFENGVCVEFLEGVKVL